MKNPIRIFVLKQISCTILENWQNKPDIIVEETEN